MIKASQAADIAYTDQVSGIPGNFLIPSLVAAGIDPSAWGGKAIDLGKELTAPEAAPRLGKRCGRRAKAWVASPTPPVWRS